MAAHCYTADVRLAGDLILPDHRVYDTELFTVISDSISVALVLCTTGRIATARAGDTAWNIVFDSNARTFRAT